MAIKFFFDTIQFLNFMYSTLGHIKSYLFKHPYIWTSFYIIIIHCFDDTLAAIECIISKTRKRLSEEGKSYAKNINADYKKLKSTVSDKIKSDQLIVDAVTSFNADMAKNQKSLGTISSNILKKRSLKNKELYDVQMNDKKKV